MKATASSSCPARTKATAVQNGALSSGGRVGDHLSSRPVGSKRLNDISPCDQLVPSIELQVNPSEVDEPAEFSQGLRMILNPKIERAVEKGIARRLARHDHQGSDWRLLISPPSSAAASSAWRSLNGRAPSGPWNA